MGLQCRPIWGLKGIHKRVENQLIKEKNASKTVKDSKKSK